MPRVRYTGGNGYYIRLGPYFEDTGDDAEVDDETADRLTDRPDFERVVESADAVDSAADETAAEDEAGGGDTADAESGADAEADPTDTVTADVGGYDTVEAFLDRTPVSDPADEIRAGAVDEHLDEIKEAADRITVEETVDKRRAELEA